jgi:hypothetical protein
MNLAVMKATERHEIGPPEKQKAGHCPAFLYLRVRLKA